MIDRTIVMKPFLQRDCGDQSNCSDTVLLAQKKMATDSCSRLTASGFVGKEGTNWVLGG